MSSTLKLFGLGKAQGGVEEEGITKRGTKKAMSDAAATLSRSKLTSEKPKIRERQTTNTNTGTCKVAITKRDACNFVSHNMTVAVQEFRWLTD